jgi:hypothetical protein
MDSLTGAGAGLNPRIPGQSPINKFLIQGTKILKFPPKVNPVQHEKTPTDAGVFQCVIEEKKDAQMGTLLLVPARRPASHLMRPPPRPKAMAMHWRRRREGLAETQAVNQENRA